MYRNLSKVLVIFLVIGLFFAQAIQPVYAKDFSHDKYPVYPSVSNLSVRLIAAQNVILDFNSDSPGTYYYLVYENSAFGPDTNQLIAQADGIAKGTGSASADLNSVAISGLTMQTGYVVYVLVDNARDGVSYISNIGSVAFTTKSLQNTAPNRKSTVPAVSSVNVQLNTDFHLNLLDIFEDIDSDGLVFQVSVNGAASTAAAANYTFASANVIVSRVALPSCWTFTFKANDLWRDSTDTYTVTVNYYRDFPGGTGTADDPYLITEPKHLDSIRYFQNRYFELAADIDLAGYTSSNCSLDKGWSPISDFYGYIDGGEEHHTISNLYINRGNESLVGLFGSIYRGAKISNIGLINVNISGDKYVGGFIGKNGIYDAYSLEITNCYVTGSVKGNNYVGGIAGYNNERGNITGCYMTGSVVGNTYTGGIAGYNKSKISNSFSAANITGYMNTGGIAGVNNGRISKCYSDSYIGDKSKIGGITGLNSGQIDNCYFSGMIKGSMMLGGIVGFTSNSTAFTVTNCYSTGRISTVNYTGAIIGYGSATVTVTSSYWDQEYSDVFATWSDLGTSKTTLEMKTVATFLNWDFNTVWSMDNTINGGYPHLTWQNADALKNHTVTFKDYDGTVLKTETVGHGKSASAPIEPQREGYIFLYWDLTYTNIIADISIKAVYRKAGMSNPFYPGIDDILIEVSDISCSDAMLSFSSDLIGLYYYIITPASNTFIDILEYRPSADSLNALLEINSISLTDLYGSTEYRAYIVIEDFDSRIQYVAETSFTTEDCPNTLSNRRYSISATGSASLVEGETYNLDLDSIFEDADGDPLIYFVLINNLSSANANTDYSYTPASAGNVSLVFTVYDGKAYSTDSYTVNITVDPKIYAVGNGTELEVSVDKENKTAMVEIEEDADEIFKGELHRVITVPDMPDVRSYSLGIPASSLSISEGTGSITMQTAAGDIEVPEGMLSNIEGTEGKEAEITISKVDKNTLPIITRLMIGSRPLIEISLKIDNEQTDWNNPDAPVLITIPYEPTELERKNPDSIIVWYIDGKGELTCISNGKYDPVKGVVTFQTTHFSNYSIGYNKIYFNDVSESALYYDAMNFVASRQIMAPTGYRLYSPEAKLTRAESLVMLMKAYNIEPDVDLMDNFDDAGRTEYAGYLAAAKRLKLSSGVGDNKFEPNAVITNQETFTFLYNILTLTDKLPDGGIQKSLSEFNDGNTVAQWAGEPIQRLIASGIVNGSDNSILPYSNTTRAGFAQMIYDLLKMQ